MAAAEGNLAEGSRSIMDSALYLVEERLDSFKDCSWPFDSGSCTPLKVGHSVPSNFHKMYGTVCSWLSLALASHLVSHIFDTITQIAEAGFYYCGTSQSPDWVRCVVCHSDIDGWEATDVPL